MDAAAYKLLQRAGCLLIGIGLVGSVLCSLSFLLFNLLASNEDISFPFFKWSPSGERLAFLVSRENRAQAIYVVDANGKRQTIVFDDFCRGVGRSNCWDEINYLRWSEDEQTLYFATLGESYSVSIDGDDLRKVDAANVPLTSRQLPVSNSTLCDDAGGIIKEMQIDPTRHFVAQMVAMRHSWQTNELQICDLRTGERSYRFNGADYLPMSVVCGSPTPIFVGVGLSCLGLLLQFMLKLIANR